MGSIVLAGAIGTIIEWYDFLIYGTAAALVFNSQFFPSLDPLAGTLAALGTYAVGFFARPLGGVMPLARIKAASSWLDCACWSASRCAYAFTCAFAARATASFDASTSYRLLAAAALANRRSVVEKRGGAGASRGADACNAARVAAGVASAGAAIPRGVAPLEHPADTASRQAQQPAPRTEDRDAG